MRKKHSLTWLIRVFLIAVTVVTIYPLIWNVYSAFKTSTEFLLNPFSLPQGLAWDNFARAWEKSNIGGNLLSSLPAPSPPPTASRASAFGAAAPCAISIWPPSSSARPTS